MPRMINASSSRIGTSFAEIGRNPRAAIPSWPLPAAPNAYACAVRAIARSAVPPSVLSTARSAHIRASSGWPDITIQLAKEVAARAPDLPLAVSIVGLPGGLQAIPGAGRTHEQTQQTGQGVAASALALT